MKDVTLNQKEQSRLSVLNSVLEYQVPIAQAAELLEVSPRHARRMLAAYREHGAAALAHSNRGRRPHNATLPAEAVAVAELATQRYEGANHTHLTELLREREGIDLSRPTVRRILTRAGIGSPRSRRSPQHRFRRQRMPQAGMLIQLDGSHHAWLEDRGPKFALLLAVDDATSAVVNAVFCVSENTAGYFTLLEGLIEGWGIPLALYSDRHAVFKHNARFAVQPEHSEPAYRPLDPDLCLAETLCFKDTHKVARDNTVKYQWRILQLLPDQERTSYAGLRVEVLERPDGELIVRYEGRRVATQKPPPRMGALWAAATAWSPGPELKRIVSSVGITTSAGPGSAVWLPWNRCVRSRLPSNLSPERTPPLETTTAR